jgi:hypothetical protein
VQTMNLYGQEPIRVGEMIRRACVIERKNDNRVLPVDAVWFELPESMSLPPDDDVEPFLTLMLLPAMTEGRTLHIEGTVSHTLLSNLTEFRDAWHCGNPSQFKRIEFASSKILNEPPLEGREGAVAPFSGGVDSSFSVWRHATNRVGYRSQQIKYGFMAQGFDIPLEAQDVFHNVCVRASQTLRTLNIRLFPFRTNCRAVSGVHWLHLHGAGVASCLQFFKRMCRVGIIGSSEPYDSMAFPVGTNPITDHLFSTSGFDVMHDGAAYSRDRKLVELSAWEQGYSHLRVCWRGKNENCGRCEKCVRTLLNFHVNGLPVPQSFPRLLRTADILRKQVYYPHVEAEWRHLLRTAVRNRVSPRFTFAIVVVLLRSAVQNRLASGVKMARSVFQSRPA